MLIDEPIQALAAAGCAVMTVTSFTNTLALLEVILLHAPLTIT